ncbi:heme exporter protein CcmD [Limnohabitans sp. 103DPR2]|uniref:heme exporter protein CcmD n=1 Tax=Limnohabitans sp. 103DPR2 TaxID=1678129 RepID=UPI0006DC14A8|nr:heme exporter protein CcmD [Limnohabitans sp. 103DPR2]ALK91529.1 Heme exporter protein D (CcmD) [Limnohabitans sp. 103DPR2]
MIWNSWSDFWAMGGYGVYVWGSFGVTAALILIEMWWVQQARAKALSQVAQELAAAQTQGKDWQR